MYESESYQEISEKTAIFDIGIPEILGLKVSVEFLLFKTNNSFLSGSDGTIIYVLFGSYHNGKNNIFTLQ